MDMVLGFAAFVVMAVASTLWFRAMGRVAIPENRSGFVVTWAFAGALGILALLGEPGWLGGTAAVLSVAAAIFFLFTVMVGDQKTGDAAIRVGATLPHFTAIDEHGQPFDSESLVGHPVLIKFFRAHW